MDIVTYAASVVKTKELIRRAEAIGLQPKVIDVLPESGDSDILYILPSGSDYYEYVWTGSAFKLISVTSVNPGSDYHKAVAQDVIDDDMKERIESLESTTIADGTLWLSGLK